MSIKIEYLVKRNKITFENFCKKENIKSFEDLLAYCLDRGFEPYLEEEFNKIFIIEKDLKKPEKVVVLKSEPKKKTEIRKRTSRKRTTKSSSAHKVTKTRDADS
tara:strand:- start:151 stop:462 length:312 start_codon:yes stop_codon:yes gene_type:complete